MPTPTPNPFFFTESRLSRCLFSIGDAITSAVIGAMCVGFVKRFLNTKVETEKSQPYKPIIPGKSTKRPTPGVTELPAQDPDPSALPARSTKRRPVLPALDILEINAEFIKDIQI
ncbi:uncharacterized protein BDZ99DRAFT_198533 [Mytilinidion resinicola]|uniref:Uncharacterized protein n=1 Tax=Mytilinidion resinicola TaxID=574789 RepID=A0A6A6Z349_9PEZI|nr:uncharacterized protein BDZ99DRAFT_198533 [Mytilinidion resinicola]KAF2815561.1 hypothetical protein BDZ99DRAFT_198533 [Mytilinidion resinicola]